MVRTLNKSGPKCERRKGNRISSFFSCDTGSFIVISNLSNTERKGALLERIKKKKVSLKYIKEIIKKCITEISLPSIYIFNIVNIIFSKSFRDQRKNASVKPCVGLWHIHTKVYVYE